MSSFFTANFLVELLLSAVRMATPILLVALAETYSERAGMVNIGLDGIMSIGALVGFLVGYRTGSPWAGILAGAAAGILVNMIYAFCTITLCAEQTVYGMAINIFAPALASFIYRLSFSDTSTLIQGVSMEAFPIPVLSQIPVLGNILFNQSILVYAAYLMVPVTSVFLNKTRAGLNFKAVGEFPKAAETLGIHVVFQKYIACILCGAMAGIGGAYLTICYTSTYSEGIVAGRGFIALSAVIFGRWNAFRRADGLSALWFLRRPSDSPAADQSIHAVPDPADDTISLHSVRTGLFRYQKERAKGERAALLQRGTVIAEKLCIR